jgi:carbonic anhydrase
MISRRLFCKCASSAGVFAATSVAVSSANANECQVFTKERQQSVSPTQAIERLQAGNQRFIAGKTVNCDLMAQVRATAAAQAPFAAIVGCIDSRVPPELVFDQRIGDVFSARIAGNFVNTDIIGSLEFAAKLAGVKAIVVLGHSECGAIKGAVDDAKLGNLTAMLANITPAVDASVPLVSGDRTSKNKKLVQKVADINAQLAVKKILNQSPVLKELVDTNQLTVVSAMHDLETGKVSFFM